MKYAALHGILLSLGLGAFAGCARCDQANTVAQEDARQETLVTKTDLAALERLVNVPFRPREVRWSTSKTHGGSDWTLTVLFTLSQEDTQRLLALPEASAGGHMTVPHDVFETWFPEAAKADYRSQTPTAGAVELEGVQLPESVFAAPEKSPAIHGRAIVLEKHNLVYLGLFTM